MNRYFMVLNDGETYTDIDQCKIIAIEDNTDEDDYDAVIKARYEAEIAVAAHFVEDEGEGVTMTLKNGVTVSFN